jgi:hypothetical protein
MASQYQKWWKIKPISLAACSLLAVVGIAVYFKLLRSEPATNIAANAVSIVTPIPAPAGFIEQFTGKEKDHGQVAEPASHVLDPVLELAREALAQLQNEIDDYTGRLIKRERIKGVLGNEVQMEFKIRTRREVDGKVTRPLSAYLKFIEPKSARGREVIWTEGANGNKLTGHEGGYLNLVRVQLEPTGMLAMMDNKYPITEIGLTRLVEKLIEKGERDRLVGPCEVQVVEDQHVGDRICRLIHDTIFTSHRSLLIPRAWSRFGMRRFYGPRNPEVNHCLKKSTLIWM